MEQESPIIGREGANLTPPEWTASYLKARYAYRELTKRAERISRGSGGIWVEGNRLAYASLLFTRLTVMAKSIEHNLPLCRPHEHWDFSAVASLSRNLSEAYLCYFWLCEDEIDADLRQSRFVLLYCHDFGSRSRLFPGDAPESDDNVVMADLIQRFNNNPYLRTLNDRQRREALRGHKTPFIQDDILQRMGEDTNLFRTMYRFFSQHTHTGPISFFRMREHDRGTGVETVHEKTYMIQAIDFTTTILSKAISGHLKLFTDAETRTPHLTNQQVARNVEREQWREKSARKSKSLHSNQE